MIETIDEALESSLFAGITMPASPFIQSANLEFVWYNSDRHDELRKSGIGPYGSIQHLGDAFDPTRKPPPTARISKYKTGSNNTRAIIGSFPEPYIFTYQVNLWAEKTRAMAMARTAFLKRFKRRHFRSMMVDAYGDGELVEVKPLIIRNNGNPIDSLQHPRHSEFAYTFEVRGWIWDELSYEVATFTKFIQGFGVQDIQATFSPGGQLDIQFTTDYS